MITLDSDVLKYVKNNKGKIIEIASFPEKGATSAAMYLLSSILEESEVGLFLEKEESARGAQYFNSFIDKSKENILIGSYCDRSDIESIASNVSDLDYLVIDDFYSCILHKRFTYIKDMMRFFKQKILENPRLTIIFLNQYRYIINNDEYNFAQMNDSIKTLYWEHLEEFVDARFEVTKEDDTNDIYLKLKSKKDIKTASNSFSLFLNSIEF